MAFVVEDGTIVSGANSYVAVAYADSYFADRGITSWTGLTSVKQAALIKATDYVESFNEQFRDTSQDGDLYFPSNNESGMGEMPSALLKATCEYALISLTTSLVSNPTVDATGQQLSGFEKTVGPITTKKQFTGSVVPKLMRWPTGDNYLKKILRPSNSVVRA